MFKGKAIGKINDFQKDGGWVATNVQECTTTGKMGNVIILLNAEIPIITISVSLSLNNLNRKLLFLLCWTNICLSLLNLWIKQRLSP